MWEIETPGEIAAGVTAMCHPKKKSYLASRKDDSRNVNLLVYPALIEYLARIVQKFIFGLDQKEIISNSLLR